MGPGEIHPWVLANVIVRLLSVIFERSLWLREAPEHLKNTDVTHIFKKDKRKESGKLEASQLHFYPWEGDAATHAANYFQTHEGWEGD